MSFPMKPWEMNNGFTNGNGPPYVPNVPNTNMLHSSAVPYPGSGGGGAENPIVTSSHSAPVMPPRPSQCRPLYSSGASMYRGGYGGYGSSAISPYSSFSSPYSFNSYGSYGGGYGGLASPYNSMYNRGGMGGYSPYGPEMGFSQLAEESAGPAFESIQSFVAAFGSISMMLESTFAAVHSSFRAVVGVADHMGRLKQVFSAFAAFRFFKWIFRRFLYLIGLSKIRPEDVESVWRNLNEASEIAGQHRPKSTSSWPILMFLGFIFAGPYLMYKLMASLQLNSNKDSEWATGSGDHFLAEATYDFEGIDERELPLRTGQTIRLAPAKFQPPNVKGWVLASDGVRSGLVPTNHLKVLGKRRPTTSALAKASSGPKEPKSVTFNLPPPTPGTSNGIFESDSEKFDM